MIPRAHLIAWSATVPWTSIEQVEQDLVLRRLVIEIARDPRLRDELAFWGGTCLHTLHFAKPLRYSEDLDYRRRTSGPVGPVLDALRGVATRVGLAVAQSRTGRHPKLRLRAPFETGAGTMTVKIELNTREREPVRGFETRAASIDSPWFSGTADVVTFATEEILATKIRALYQRDKGRDLFDLWLGLDQLALDGEEIARIFDVAYRPEGFRVDRVVELLRERRVRGAFDADLLPLLGTGKLPYDAAAAVDRVERDVLAAVRPTAREIATTAGCCRSVPSARTRVSRSLDGSPQTDRSIARRVSGIAQSPGGA
jgi:predicted nucleotidyltransferase component of viral defense system